MMNIKERRPSLSVPRWSLPSWNEDKPLLLGTGDVWGQARDQKYHKDKPGDLTEGKGTKFLPVLSDSSYKSQGPHEMPNHSTGPPWGAQSSLTGEKSLETQVLSQKQSGMLLLLLSEPFQGSLSHSRGSLNVLNKPWLDPQSVQVSYNLTLSLHSGLELLLNHSSATNGQGN